MPFPLARRPPIPNAPLSRPVSGLVGGRIAAGMLMLVAARGRAEPIFPDLFGDELLQALVEEYTPDRILSYDDAKDKLFGEIDNHDDSLTCVYTGLTIYMDPSRDPSSWAESHGINTEHTWPQSKGANGSAKGDMHNLFPTRDVTNAARGNLPFGDIFDGVTDRWWRLDYSQSEIPESHIDEYSEEDSGVRFEVREDHKGNAARAMFYFYTIYREKADAEDPYFFDRQKEALRRWHAADPVDAREIERTYQIAAYQSGKPNPFVIDTTLVRRAYFDGGVSVEEGPSGEGQAGSERGRKIRVEAAPNPFNPEVTIAVTLDRETVVWVEIVDRRGKRVATLVDGISLGPGTHRLHWDGGGSPSGVYLARVRSVAGPLARLRLVLLK